MIQNVKKYSFLIIMLGFVLCASANNDALVEQTEPQTFTAKIPLGNSTVDAIFTINSQKTDEVMIGYDNFYNQADVISPGSPGSSPEIGEGEYQTAIDKSTSGNLTIPATVQYNGKTYTVTGIANHAFAECTKLTYISIPNTIEDIDTYAFNGCSGLTGLEVNLTTPLDVTSSIFEGSYQATLYVPKGCTRAYATANFWKLFKAFSEIGADEGLKGDVNLDGTVNILDVVAVINYILGEVVDPFSEENADMNDDGDVNITDVTAIVNVILSGE